MRISDVRQRNIGVNFCNGLAEILVWAPNARNVALVVENEDIKLVPQEFGYWRISTQSLKPGMSYRISLDDEAFPDITSLQQHDVHGASYAIDLNTFDWQDAAWKNHELKDYIIYELHTGTFTGRGTFQAITEKMDHLLSLGVNAIEIMPLAQFPGERNWGYDGVYPFAVQHSYGGADGLQSLINLCHQKGMAVIIDVVYNHIGPEGNYFSNYGPYFTEKYKTPWGNAINFDDAQCDPVRNYFIENALMWFRDFHVDALRLDAVNAIKDLSPKHILREIREHTDALKNITGKQYYLIAECDLNDKRFIDPAEKDGYGMDAQWTDEFHHALRMAAGGEKKGYYTDFKGVGSLAESLKHAFVYHGQYSQHRQKCFGTDPVDNPGQQFIVFSQNHDQVGNRMLGERGSQLFSIEMQKLMAATVMVSPFVPMLFMGEEWAASSPFQYFVSHGDEKLIDAVRVGRKEEFKDFHGSEETPDPQSDETFARSKLKWHELSNEPHQTMFDYYRTLIRLRVEQPSLKYPDRENTRVSFDEPMQVLTLKRWCKEQELICIMNFSKVIRDTSEYIDSANWRMIFNSEASKWAEHEMTQGNEEVYIAPESIIVYSR